MSIVRSIGFDRGIHISSESNRVNRPSWVVAWLLHIRLSPIICYSPLSLAIYSPRIALLSLRQSFKIILKFSLNIPLIHSISLGSFQWNRSLRGGMPASHPLPPIAELPCTSLNWLTRKDQDDMNNMLLKSKGMKLDSRYFIAWITVDKKIVKRVKFEWNDWFVHNFPR